MEVTSLARNNFRVVTVNMYSPHVKDEEVRAFMVRYMDNVSSARLLKDSLGFWNGEEKLPGSVEGRPKGPGRLPSSSSSVLPGGLTGGRCIMPVSPLSADDAWPMTRDCDESKKCHGCGSSAHLWRECAARHKSNAAAAGRGAGAGEGDGGGRGGEFLDTSTGNTIDNGGGAEDSRRRRGGRAGDCRSRSGRRGGVGDGDEGECGRGGAGDGGSGGRGGRGGASHSPGRRAERGRGGGRSGGKAGCRVPRGMRSDRVTVRTQREPLMQGIFLPPSLPPSALCPRRPLLCNSGHTRCPVCPGTVDGHRPEHGATGGLRGVLFAPLRREPEEICDSCWCEGGYTEADPLEAG
ncbi:unnamed protein product [Coregonus sp. 'balchen']|nr:unnamed protein product [Coregonus sp. 'balchen']